jgi:Protein of unknown function (DUF3037)
MASGKRHAGVRRGKAESFGPPLRILDKTVATRFECILYRIRWISNLLTGDPTTVGIMMFNEATDFADVKVTTDRRRLQSLDANIDSELLSALETEFRSRIADPESRALFLGKVLDWSSNSLQFSVPGAVITDDPATEFARQVTDLLETLRLPVATRELGETAKIRREMINCFKKQDVWAPMLKHISMGEYLPRNRIKIDCGYMTLPAAFGERQFKMFHALSIEEDSARISELAESYPAFKKSFSERMEAETLLTVISRDWNDVASPESEHAPYAALHQAGINTNTVRDVPTLAANARLDLGLRPM